MSGSLVMFGSCSSKCRLRCMSFARFVRRKHATPMAPLTPASATYEPPPVQSDWSVSSIRRAVERWLRAGALVAVERWVRAAALVAVERWVRAAALVAVGEAAVDEVAEYLEAVASAELPRVEVKQVWWAVAVEAILGVEAMAKVVAMTVADFLENLVERHRLRSVL
eukprot:CAMPEP_0174713032 /NCGR_PEP_ID=MMETSP1094-20130205/13834_1 /TAXON_ID=156173 /ORGANISM="Chrysochromulina brevifilum, Strain UTEX LB 985" /LENGTH=166 /DNA_ID=CAMNT_0015912167 /DNA_START=143 /DNA_END=644 /DNA_ORIENTATION=-